MTNMRDILAVNGGFLPILQVRDLYIDSAGESIRIEMQPASFQRNGSHRAASPGATATAKRRI